MTLDWKILNITFTFGGKHCVVSRRSAKGKPFHTRKLKLGSASGVSNKLGSFRS